MDVYLQSLYDSIGLLECIFGSNYTLGLVEIFVHKNLGLTFGFFYKILISFRTYFVIKIVRYPVAIATPTLRRRP